MYLGSYPSTADLATYTFSDVSFGDAAPTRIIIITAQARKSGSGPVSVVSVSIDGIAATIDWQRSNVATNGNVSCIAHAIVPTGTTGVVVVQFSATMLRCSMTAYRKEGITDTPYDIDESLVSFPTMTLDIPDNGFVVGCATAGGTLASIVWNGLTEDYENQVEASRFTSASGTFESGIVNHSIQIAKSGGGDNWTTEPVAIVVSWGPSEGGEEPEPTEVDLGQSASIETTQSLLAENPRGYTLGQSSSTEATQTLSAPNPREYTAGQSGSVEAIQPLVVSNPRSYIIGQSSSVESTQSLSVSNPRSYEIGQSSSAELVQSLSVSQAGSFTFGQASSIEAAQSLGVTNPRSYTIGQSSSAESVASLEVSQANIQTVVIGQSSSIEAVIPLIVSNPRTYTTGQSVSTEHVADLIVGDGTATTIKQYVFQTIDGPYFFQTQS